MLGGGGGGEAHGQSKALESTDAGGNASVSTGIINI